MFVRFRVSGHDLTINTEHISMMQVDKYNHYEVWCFGKMHVRLGKSDGELLMAQLEVTEPRGDIIRLE